MIMAEGIDRVLSDFIVESRENLERLDHDFVTLENDPSNKELLAGIFRTIHTIKGSAGFLSLTNLEQVSHYAEDVLARIREQSLVLDSDITTALLQAVDSIKTILRNLEMTSEEGEHDILPVVVQLKHIAEGQSLRAFETPHWEPCWSTVEHQDDGRLIFDDDDQASGPAHTATEQKLSETLQTALLSTEESRIHVDTGLLDRLMNLTGELVLSRNQVVQFANDLDERPFRAMAQRMSVVVSELQEIVMKTRMQAVRRVFGMFPRLVRDLSKLYGKDIELRMEGPEHGIGSHVD
jgi:two-component system, chemotaxis family, sensor kinase CheA